MSMDLLTPVRRKSGEENLIPMINVVFLLLIFFMVAGQIKAQSSNNIELPISASGEKPETISLRLEVDRHNQLYLNGQGISLNELESSLENISTENLQIALVADKTLNAANLEKVLQVFRKNGLADIQLLTTLTNKSATLEIP